jgi:hypothetical protein
MVFKCRLRTGEVFSMIEAHFLSTQEIERFLQHKPQDLQEIVLELRNLVAAVAPQATEKIQWRGISYYDADRGGVVKGGICQIGIYPEHVRLSFIHGAFLPDPEALLQGDRKAKRFVRLTSYEETPWEAVTELIKASASFNPASLAS